MKKQLPLMHSFVISFHRLGDPDNMNPKDWQELVFAADLDVAKRKATAAAEANLGDIKVMSVVPFLKEAGRIGQW